jgi:integrase
MGRKKKIGRVKGSRNRGYFYRKSRGWYIRAKGEPKLCDLDGNHLKSLDDADAARLAYAKHIAQFGGTLSPSQGDHSIQVADACQLYLAHVQRHGAVETYRLRADLLFDFCSGFPASFRDREEEATAEDRLHDGYGNKWVADLRPSDIQEWVDKHPNWKSNRAAVQAIRRAINYCVVEQKLIPENPIRGVKVAQVGKRLTYFTPEVEEALYQWASPALALAIRVCIHTGARPMIEFGRLEKRHVQVDEHGNMTWHFPANEAKVRSKPRIIQVPRCIKPLVEAAMKKHPTGKLFRNDKGEPWGDKEMKNVFAKLRQKLIRKKVPIEPTDVMYTCRHTFAKRQLGGYWTDKPVSIEVLAGLMGNTPKVCWEHYGQWHQKYAEPLRNAVDY